MTNALHRLRGAWRERAPLTRGIVSAFVAAIALSLCLVLLMALLSAGQWREELRQAVRTSGTHMVWMLAVVVGAAVAFRQTR